MYKKHLSEPWFTLVLLGYKTIEGRLDKGDFEIIEARDIIEWFNEDIISRSFMTRVIRKTKYESFRDYLRIEGLEKSLPGITNLEDALKIYAKFYSTEEEKKFGVIALEIEKIKKIP